METSQLSVWLAAVASIHMIGPLKDLRRGFAAYAASSVFLALYVTRSGVSPLHSFAAESFAAVILLAASLILMIVSILLFSDGIGALIDELQSNLRQPTQPPRVTGFGKLSTMLLIIGSSSIAIAALIVYSSLFTPSLLKLLGFNTQPPSFEQGVRFYNTLMMPLALASLYAVAGYYLSVWAGRKAVYAFFITLTVALSIIGLATIRGTLVVSPLSDKATNLASAILLAGGSISSSTLLTMALWKTYSVIRGRAAKGVYTLRIILEKLVHASMLMILVSVALSGSYAYNRGYAEEVFVPLGGEANVMGVTISYEGFDYETHQGSIDLKNNLDENIYYIQLEKL
ncbi:hypothetical protein [Aeropyrum camini]|uniref:hypothetical protein n=1 Tax=Aeropyrum camini TaxID=229980 RepID=UPI00138F86BE|nr:hypothetical protein [Aeropyrum camini]